MKYELIKTLVRILLLSSKIVRILLPQSEDLILSERAQVSFEILLRLPSQLGMGHPAEASKRSDVSFVPLGR